MMRKTRNTPASFGLAFYAMSGDSNDEEEGGRKRSMFWCKRNRLVPKLTIKHFSNPDRPCRKQEEYEELEPMEKVEVEKPKFFHGCCS